MKYRVSHVEAFRQWEADEESDVADLVEKIAGGFEPSEAMRAGTAFHRALELAPTGLTVDSLEAEGYRFLFRGDFEVQLSPIRELRASKTYVVDGRPIVISGQLDQIDGKRVDDHKTTSRFDPDRYLAGFQWRLYLDIFGADRFRWNVFEMAAADEPKVYEIFAQHRLEQFRYPAMRSDCEALVERFARFVRAHIEVTAEA
jgi:hypothetical protein